MRLLNLGVENSLGMANGLALDIKHCRRTADLSGKGPGTRKMIPNHIALCVIVAFALSGSMAHGNAQDQPPVKPQTQSPAQQPTDSPAIIAPPSGSPVAGSKADPKAGAGKSQKNAVNAGPAPAADPTAVGPTYVIGPEDVLYIRVWQQPELSGTVSVGPDGTISLQLIDEVKAAGFTPHQLEAELVQKLKKFIVEPEVNIQVLRVNSRIYIILGDGVTRPGIYPLTRPMTVLEALIAGGGFSPFAKKNKIYVLRGTTKYPFNWNEVSKGKKLEQNIIIQNKDQIYVP